MMVKLDTLTELKQILTKELLNGELYLCKIRKDFYINAYRLESKESNIILAKIKRGRMIKLSRLACVFTPIGGFIDSLTPEEIMLYNGMVGLMKEFWKDE